MRSVTRSDSNKSTVKRRRGGVVERWREGEEEKRRGREEEKRRGRRRGGEERSHLLTSSGLISDWCPGDCGPWLVTKRTTARGIGSSISLDSTVDAGTIGQPSASGFA